METDCQSGQESCYSELVSLALLSMGKLGNPEFRVPWLRVLADQKLLCLKCAKQTLPTSSLNRLLKGTTQIHVYMYAHMHTFIHTYNFTFVHMFLYAYIHTNIHTYPHIHIHPSIAPWTRRP